MNKPTWTITVTPAFVKGNGHMQYLDEGPPHRALVIENSRKVVIAGNSTSDMLSGVLEYNVLRHRLSDYFSRTARVSLRLPDSDEVWQGTLGEFFTDFESALRDQNTPPIQKLRELDQERTQTDAAAK
jgi:hypothetical protein